MPDCREGSDADERLALELPKRGGACLVEQPGHKINESSAGLVPATGSACGSCVIFIGRSEAGVGLQPLVFGLAAMHTLYSYEPSSAGAFAASVRSALNRAQYQVEGSAGDRKHQAGASLIRGAQIGGQIV